MDIAAMSIDLHNSNLQMNAGIAITKKAMDQAEVTAEGLMAMIPPVDPDSDLGQNVNVKG